MNLLLVNLGIRTEKYNSRILLVLRCLVILDVCKWVVLLHLFYRPDLLIIKRKEHTVKLCPILRLDPKSATIKILLEQTLSLVMAEEHICKNQPKHIRSATQKVERIVGFPYDCSKPLAIFLEVIHHLDILF